MAQTREQIITKIDALLKDARAEVQKEVQMLLDSGAVDLDDAEDNYRLPKLLYIAALQRLAASYEPRNAEDKKVLKNLSAF
jgi:hypothetical protein